MRVPIGSKMCLAFLLLHKSTLIRYGRVSTEFSLFFLCWLGSMLMRVMLLCDILVFFELHYLHMMHHRHCDSDIRRAMLSFYQHQIMSDNYVSQLRN